MSSDQRPLLPAPPGARPSTERSTSSGQGPSKKTVPAACVSCRQKKRRCSRTRPTCAECSATHQPCVYDTLPGETLREMHKSQKGRMESDLSTMTELFWYLRTGRQEDVAKAVAAIISGLSPDQIVQDLKSDTPDNEPDGVDQASSSAKGKTPASRAEPSSETPTDGAERSSADVLEALTSGVDAFNTCTGCILHIYEEDEAHELLDIVRTSLQNAGPTWSEVMFDGSATISQKTSLSAVCIMAAIGLQYTKHPIPALGFKSSSERGTYEHASTFYGIARHLVEDVMEHDLVGAIKICTAICLFNIIGHATVASMYAEAAINLARRFCPSFQHRPPSLSETAWANHKRVVRTLLTLRAWITVTMGYIADDNHGALAMHECLQYQEGTTAKETIQQELLKVVRIEADLIRTLESFRSVSLRVLASTRSDLNQWHERLPQWMKLDTLITAQESVQVPRRTVFLLHLFYLAAYILVARIAHGRENSVIADGELMKLAIGDGIVAARTASRILQLQLDEGAVFQRCWLSEYTAYMSCLMLLHSAVHMLLRDVPQAVVQKELSHAKSCLDVLDYCGIVDDVALLFAEKVRGFHNTLHGECQDDTSDLTVESPTTFEYIFDAPASPSPPHLREVESELYSLLGRPFGQSADLRTEGILKTGFGSQQEWKQFITLPFNQKVSQASRSSSSVGLALPDVQAGRFAGSIQPHGWDRFVNMDRM